MAICGCVYTFTNSRPFWYPNIKTIAVPVFLNTSLEPQAGAFCTETLRKEISESGKLVLSDYAKSDALVLGQIVLATEGVVSKVEQLQDELVNRALYRTINEYVTLSVQIKVVSRLDEKVIYQTSLGSGAGIYAADVSSSNFYFQRKTALQVLCQKIADLFINRFTGSF